MSKELDKDFEETANVNFSQYKDKDLWSEATLQELCCGLEPGGVRPRDVWLNEAAEDIRLAVLAGKLPVISPSDASAGDRMYGHARFFRPADAIRWAAPKFPKFPFANTHAEKVADIPGASQNGDDWRVKARAIADELFGHDTKGKCRDSLLKKKNGRIVGGYSFRVMELMQERGIKGVRGIIDNPATIMREALQGDKWWANKSK